MRLSAKSITMILCGESMPDTDAQDTVKSITSSMDDPYAHVIE